MDKLKIDEIYSLLQQTIRNYVCAINPIKLKTYLL